MRIAIFGAGAVGGHLAARLGALDDVTLSVVARGPQLAAIRKDGLRLVWGARQWRCRPQAATDDPATLPPQDIVFVTLKSPAIPSAAQAIGRLLAPSGVAVFLMNGLPWWAEERAAPGASQPAAITKAIGADRFLAGVVYSSNHVERPGVIRHEGYDVWQVGEPGGILSARSEEIAALLRSIGLNGMAEPDIQPAIWTKLMLNASGNTLTALTRLDSAAIIENEQTAALTLAVRREIASVAGSLGYDHERSPLVQSLDDVKGHSGVKPSMLQDVLAGRQMEVDTLIDAPRRIAKARGIATPTLDCISALLNGLNRSLEEGQPG